ncbi:MAG TPA: hypothetical protein VNE39_24705 [Planctomycetota bacterium]|nr:hypothetical protein [Planctomycetota bacterium]
MRWVSLLAVLGLPVFAGEAFEWPKIRYNGQVRGPEWLEEAYRKHKDRVVLTMGSYHHLDEPMASVDPRYKGKGDKLWQIATVVRVTEQRDVLCRLGDDTVVLAPFLGNREAKAEAVVLLMRTGFGRETRWSARQLDAQGVSREQFLEALLRGLQLVFWQTCPECKGRGWVAVRKWRDVGSKPESYLVKQVCPECDGTGQAVVKADGR